MAAKFVDEAKAIRHTPHTVRRAAALIGSVREDPKVGPLITRMSVAAVIRLAAVEGLEVLEARYGVSAEGGKDGQE